MARPKNTDDLMFDSSDEFFPLDNSSTKGDKSKAPKGVKSYLKNVAKSVKNLSVSVAKTMYPEADKLIQSVRGDQDEGKAIDIKATINKYKGYVTSAKAEVGEIAKDIGKSAKEAVKTGYFFKTEDEANDMSAAFGDMFGDDFNFDDFGDFGGDDDFDDGDDGGGSTKKGRINTGDAVVKSSAASTKALLHASNKQSSVIIGATQSQIKHETQLFAQQIMIEQEHHKEKMRVLKNIATNIAKTVNQNNISIKAQMEYSLKSLAFTQDINAMLKEIRDAQWALTKSKEDNPNERETTRKKVFGAFGDELNLSHWMKHIKGNLGGGGAGMLGMALDGYKMMTDMGMGKGQAIMNMAGPMILESIINGMSSSSAMESRGLLNKSIAGLPRQLNQMLGNIASGDSSAIKKLESALNKTKFGSKIAKADLFGNTLGGWLQTLAGKAYIDDDTVYSTDRYTMGDPNTVHPFDNKAHKALTEVIPGFLSKISAGVNHTEEQVFDYSSNRFIKKSYFKDLAKEMHQDTIEQTENFYTSQERFLNASSKHDYSKALKNVNKSSETFKASKYVDENGDPRLENLESIYPQMLENWMSTGRSISDSSIIFKMRGIIDKNGKFVPGKYSDLILRNITTSDDYEKYVLTSAFADFLLEWAKDADKGGEASRTWREFQLSCQNYRERLSNTNMKFEDVAAMTSSSGLAQEINIDKQYETTLNNLRSKLKNLEAQRDSPTIKGKARINLQNSINDIKTQINDISRERGKISDEGINAGIASVYNSFNPSGTGDDFDNYRISSLEDSSTHGLVQNIYNLLLSGIDVYAHDPKERKESDSNFISSAKKHLPSRISASKEADSISKERMQYQEMYFPNGIPTDSQGIQDVLYNNSIVDDKGKLIYKGKIYVKNKDGKIEGVSPSSIKFEDGVQYFLKNSEKTANDQEQNRRYEIERRKEEEERRKQKANGEDVDDRDWSLPFQDVPVIGKFVKMFNDIDKGFSGTMNKILGRTFYGEVGEGKIKDTVSKSAQDIKNSTIQSAKGAVEDITGGKIKSYVADKLLSIKVGDDTLATTIAKVHDPILIEKLKAEKNPIKQGQLLIEYGKNNPEIQKYTLPIRTFIEKNEALMTASSSIKGLTSWVKDKVTSKISAGANKVFAKFMQGKLGKEIYNITIDGKTFQTALSEYYEANPAIKEANIAKGNAFEQTPGAKDIKEVSKFLKETFTSIDDPSIEPYKSQIVTICDEYASGDKSTITGAATSAVTKGINKVIDFFKNKAKGLLDKVNKGKGLIPDDMAKLQSIDGRTLGDVIEKVATDEGFKEILQNIPGGAAKAEFIIQQKSPELAGFTAALREYQKGNIKDGLKSAGKGIKSTIVGAAAFASGAWNGSNLAYKDDESEETPDEDGTDNKTKKERLRDRIKNRFKRKGNSDGVEGNSADEQKSLKLAKQESKDKDETKSLFKRMAETLESFKKEGIPLDKETKKTIEDANEKGAFQSESKNGEGVLSTIRGFLDKTGLGNTKMGRALGKATDAVGGLLDKAGDLGKLVGGGKGKLIGGLANTLSKIPGVGGAVSGIVGAVTGGGGLVSTAANAVTGGAGVLKGALGVLKTVLDKFFNLGPIKKWFKGGAVNAIKNGIAKGVTKFAPKLGAKIAAMSAASATLVVAVATAAAGFAKGMLKAKDYFKVGKGMRITIGMKLASGLANAFDMLLMGIPSLICGWLGKANVATWLYEFFGGDAEKMALERYQEYNAKRAVVFGISDPNALVAYENRSVADGVGEGIKQGFFKFLRGTASFLTLGLVDGNDEKDAKMLGFKYKKIYKYWKEKKFKPLNELREKVANEMGVKLKDMEDITAVDPTEVDEDDDGQVDNDEKAQEEMQKLELQTKYRVTYLEACRKYVLSNKIAWLTSRCTAEEFEKYTGGKSAGDEMKSFGEKVVHRLTAPVRMVKAAGEGVKKVGGAIADGVRATGEAISNAGAKVTNWLKSIYKRYNMDDKTQRLMDSAGDEIASVHLGVDKNYYGETPTGDVSVGTAGASEGMVHAGASGSSEPVGKEGYYVRVKTDRATLDAVPKKEDLDRGSATSRSSGGTSRTSPQDTTYDLSGKTPKGTVMNSIAQEFAKNFGAELNKKLDILAEMHRENLRHHDVTEKFFMSALQLLGSIAANSGNKAMATKFSDMVNQVAKF